MTFDNHVTVKTYSFATPCKIIFGGVPTSVAIPPELDAYATPSANTLLNRLISADLLFISFLKKKKRYKFQTFAVSLIIQSTVTYQKLKSASKDYSVVKHILMVPYAY